VQSLTHGVVCAGDMMRGTEHHDDRALLGACHTDRYRESVDGEHRRGHASHGTGFGGAAASFLALW
jgi:hypothetical protein